MYKIEHLNHYYLNHVNLNTNHLNVNTPIVKVSIKVIPEPVDLGRLLLESGGYILTEELKHILVE